MTIFVKEEPPGYFTLWVKSFAGENPAGPRLIKSSFPPAIEFSSFDEAEAESNCAKLQKHIDGYERKK